MGVSAGVEGAVRLLMGDLTSILAWRTLALHPGVGGVGQAHVGLWEGGLESGGQLSSLPRDIHSSTHAAEDTRSG